MYSNKPSIAIPFTASNLDNEAWHLSLSLYPLVVIPLLYHPNAIEMWYHRGLQAAMFGRHLSMLWSWCLPMTWRNKVVTMLTLRDCTSLVIINIWPMVYSLLWINLWETGQAQKPLGISLSPCPFSSGSNIIVNGPRMQIQAYKIYTSTKGKPGIIHLLCQYGVWEEWAGCPFWVHSIIWRKHWQQYCWQEWLWISGCKLR